METVVHQGSARAGVVATGTDTSFGKIAAGLTERQPEAVFQRGLREFSKLLVKVAGLLTTSIFVLTKGAPEVVLAVASKVSRDIGIEVYGTLTGAELDRMDDTEVVAAIPATTVFARVSPAQKSRVITLARSAGSDVAKDAADIILLDRDLPVLADGVVEGRRIFSNTDSAEQPFV